MFLAQIATVKQWGIFIDKGVKKRAPAVSVFVSTFLLGTHACSMFSKYSLVLQARPTIYERKNCSLISCQISPKENVALVAGQLGTNARNTPYTLCSKFKPILLRSLKNVF